MAIDGHIHWEEGLFLRPHHLQFMQRGSFDERAAERRLFHPYAYGVIESRISRDELSNLILRFDNLQLIMPSGLRLDVPGNTELPPLDITKAFQATSGPMVIRIGVPLWYPTRGNTVDDGPDADWRVKRLYRISEIERPDENTGENPQPIRVRRINARLLVEGEDETDLELLPLTRIVHGAGEEVGMPREDPAFIPACLVLGGSGILLNMARDLANAVDASRREVLDRMTRAGFSIETMRGLQFEQMLRLRTLNYYSARLIHLVEAGSLSPFAIYLELRGLLGELAALQPDRDQSQVPDYDHDSLYVTFFTLSSRIRDLLKGVVPPSFIKVDFSRDGSLFVAELTEEHFTRASEYFLAIRTSQDPVALARMVEDEDKFKLMPKSLTGRAVRGVKLVDERNPPLQLPSDPGLRYFRLMPVDTPRAWKLVQDERTLTAQWPDSTVADVQLTLYMPVVEQGADT